VEPGAPGSEAPAEDGEAAEIRGDPRRGEGDSDGTGAAGGPRACATGLWDEAPKDVRAGQ
jgi:hypothetical protein